VACDKPAKSPEPLGLEPFGTELTAEVLVAEKGLPNGRAGTFIIRKVDYKMAKRSIG
jgi:hypothetical protein